MLDLTASNPTECGFTYDATAILTALADPASLTYEPDPRGLLKSREAVCEYYAERGDRVSPDSVLLTTSTSEAYAYVFRLLCNPGNEILDFPIDTLPVAAPSSGDRITYSSPSLSIVKC